MAGNESRGKMTFGSRRKNDRSRLRAAVMGLGAGHVSRVSRKTEPSARARRKKNAVSSRDAAAARKSRAARHTTHTTYLAYARSANTGAAADTRRDRTRTTEFEVAAFDRVAIHEEDTRETFGSTRFAAEETAGESASETSESPSGRAPFAASAFAAFAAAASNVSNADSIDDSTETGSTLDGFDDRGVASSGTTAAKASYGGAARGVLSTDPSFGTERSFVSSSKFRTNANKSFVASRTREGPANAGKGEGVSGSDADASNEDASSVLLEGVEGFEGVEDVDVSVDVSRVEKRAARRGVPGVIESRDASLFDV